MVLLKKTVCCIFLFLLVMAPFTVLAGKRPVSVEINGEKAEATYLKGVIFQVRNDLPTGPSFSRGDFLDQGNRFMTDKESKIELKLPDDSFIRFGERTTFELVSVAFDEKTKQHSIDVSMILGKTWANVSKLIGKRKRFEITTRTAVCGVRGTVYRVNVKKDDTVIVKVYWGEVLVKNRAKADTAQQAVKSMKPSKVLGPQPIAGPRPVSMEEWTYIVKSMQQITIRPDGTATKPFKFSAEADSNDWVRWNKERDEMIRDLSH
jgi:hypothetical protein